MLQFQSIGIIGATSLVGDCLLPLVIDKGRNVFAFSRTPHQQNETGVFWLTHQKIDTLSSQDKTDPKLPEVGNIPFWVCLAPVWVLPDYFEVMKQSGIQRVVALSSTSRFTKHQSSDDAERELVKRIEDAESRLQMWAETEHIEWVILRPTLIYGLGKDKNIAEITRLIRRWGVFPLMGKAEGARQPLHAEDVAQAMLSALSSTTAKNKSYNISGAETLSYKDMIERVFAGLGRKPCFVNLPLSLMRLLIGILSIIPRYRHWTPAMVERMNQNLAFDHAEASRDFNFKPRPFKLEVNDLPAES